MSSYLVKKKHSSTYFFRSIVPHDLANFLKQDQFLISLDCDIIYEAKPLSQHLYQVVQSIYQVFREIIKMTEDYSATSLKDLIKANDEKFSESNIQKMLEAEIDKMKHRKDAKPLTIETIQSILKKEIQERKAKSDQSFLDRQLHPGDRQLNPIFTDLLIQGMKSSFNNGDKLFQKCLEIEVFQLLNKYGYTTDLTSQEFKILISNISKMGTGDLEYSKKLDTSQITPFDFVSRLFAEDHYQTNEQNFVREKVFQPIKVRQHLVSDVIHDFIKENSSSDKWSIKTTNEYQSVLDLFVQIVGDIPINEISFDITRQFKNVVQKLPPNMNKLEVYRGKSIEEIIEMPDIPRLETRTVNKKIVRLSTFFNWAIRNYDGIDKNYAEGLQISQKKKASNERDHFNDADLCKIFDPKKYLIATSTGKTNAKYWIPLIAIFTGARINEICQLHLIDIKQDTNIWYFNLKDDSEDKSFKNKPSEREVPVHSILINLGFIQYVEKMKQQRKQRLFPELTRGRDGYQKYIGRWFNGNYLVDIGVKTSKKVFHSFRHTVANKLKQQMIDQNLAAEILGHSVELITYHRYGKAFNIELRSKEGIEKLNYSSVDWMKLKR